MSKSALALLIGLLCAQASPAAGPATSPAPSAASVQELIADSGMKALLEKMTTQYQTTLKTSMHKAVEGKNLNADQQKIEDDAETKALEIFGHMMSWDTLGPIVVDVYSSTFTQDEVNGLIKFYTSPVGKSWIAKQPVVMEKTVAQVQLKAQDMMPELKQLQIDTVQQLRAAGTPGANTPAAGTSAPTSPPP
jgi:uncharacterized protein